MKFILSVSLPIFFILLAEALGEEYIDYRLVNSGYGRRVARAVTVNPKCDGTRKAICQDCKDMHMCLDDKSSIYVWTCADKETCFNGECTEKDVPSCSPQAELKFICSSEGIFPDPADCSKYHICVNSVPAGGATQPAKYIDYPRTCTSESGDTKTYTFTPKTSYCSIEKTAKACVTEVPMCIKALDRNPLASNPSMYYICKKYEQSGVPPKPNSPSILYPYQYICPNGKTYKKESFSCS